MTRAIRAHGAVAAAVLLGLAAATVGAGCGGQAPAAVDAKPGPDRPGPHFRFFAPTSFWNRSVPAHGPLDWRSPATVGALDAEVARELADGSGPWINTSSYSVPVLRVPRGLPTVRVGLASPYAVPALRQAFSAVPLPPHARPAAGSDAHLVVWQPSTDRLWEFWHLRRGADGWRASWGGAMAHASGDRGAYDAAAWPGATPLWGASASSLSIAGGLITRQDLNRGWINHALALSVPAVRAGIYALPARRTDGIATSSTALPEGAHLRLRPGLDLAGMDLPPLTRMIAVAAQRYGIYIRDRARTVCFYAQAPTGPSDPYDGPSGDFEGQSPSQLLTAFPWEELQLMPMRLRLFKRTDRLGGAGA
jgi:hypothetical protein